MWERGERMPSQTPSSLMTCPCGPRALSTSAGFAASGLDVDERIGGHEKDAIVSLAGWAANRHENPHLVPFDVFTDDDGDSLNARSSTMHIITLEDRKSPPVGGSVKIETDETLQTRIYQIWFRLLRRTDALVVQHWLAIERVGKHLERHRRIDNQAELDDLIARAERLAIT